VPIGIVEWELFVPDSYSVKAIDGNVIERSAFPVAAGDSDDAELHGSGYATGAGSGAGVGRGVEGGVAGGVTAGIVGGLSPAPPPAANAPRSDVKAAANEPQKQEPSQNVINLQKRAAGVLPVRVDVPRAGTSHQFVKPLVVDQETFVSLRYKRR
jgi:hypothetical protein